MGKSQKSTIEKEKPANARFSTSGSIQRRDTTGHNATRRKTVPTTKNAGNQSGTNDEVVVLGNKSENQPHTDMSGDDDEKSERSLESQKQTPPSSRTQTSMVNEFAEKLSSNEYKCKLCTKTYRCGTGTNANIRRHLANAHGKVNLYSKSQIPDQAKVAPARKRKLDEAAIKAIVIDSRSFGDFRRSGMQHFLRFALPRYYGPSARTVQRNLKKLYNDKKHELKERLADIQHVCITADSWCSGRKRHYLCITAHFLTSNYEQCGTVLSFRQFYGRSFAMRIRRHIRTVLTMFGLEKGKVHVTTTDNGSNIRKATQYVDIFGVRLHCIAHGLNLVVQKSLNLWPKMKSMAKNTGAASTIVDEDSNDDGSTISDGKFDDESSVDSQPSEDSSDQGSDKEEDADGVGDLSSADDSSESDDEDSLVLDMQEIGVLMTKCRKMINVIRKSSILNDTLLKLAKDSVAVELITDMKVRWNSTYHMVQRLLLYQHALASFYDNLETLNDVTAKQRRKLIDLKLTSVDWNVLLAMRRVLERFNDATEILSGKSYPTLSLAYPVIYSLYGYLNGRTGDVTENTVKEMMLDRFTAYVLPMPDTKQADILLNAAFLDPLVHDMLSPEHKTKAEKIF